MSELIWEGKYRDGALVTPSRAAYPLEDIELTGRGAPWHNRLIWGDKALALPALLPEFAGKVNLIYIDPPFHTGSDFTLTAPDLHGLGGDGSAWPERTAYCDSWGGGLDGYLQWLYETLVLLRDLLAQDGAIYVHLDWRVEDHARLILDEVFGRSNLRNKICWAYRSGGASRRGALARKHDTILFYARSPAFRVRPRLERQYLTKPFMGSRQDLQGRHYVDTVLRDVLEGELWVVEEDLPTAYNMRPVLNLSRERAGYPTQKPLGLLALLLRLASDPGDLVLDCFCGSGTTAVAAHQAGRRWIAADMSRSAIHTTRQRLLSLPDPPVFALQTLAAHQRQSWATGLSGPPDSPAAQVGYRGHILAAYGAQPLPDAGYLHGATTTGRLVAVAPLNEPLTSDWLTTIARAARRMCEDGVTTRSGVDVLTWEGADTLPQIIAGCADDLGVDVVVRRIPSELLDGRAAPRGAAWFPDIPTLTVEVQSQGGRVRLALSSFSLPVDHEPPESAAPDQWREWIACWEVDWDYRGGVLHNDWWSCRGRRTPVALTTAEHVYAAAGSYTMMVTAVDVLGRETRARVQVTVGGPSAEQAPLPTP